MPRGFTIATALLVLFTCMLGGAGPASAKKKKHAKPGCAGTSAAPQAATLAQSYAAVLCLINAERTARGLPALRTSAPLSQAALGHSNEMVARQYFAHPSLDGQTPDQRVLRSGYFSGGAGGMVEEALACGWMALSTPQALVASLMRSPEHRSILLDRGVRDIGIGIALGGPLPGPGGGTTLTLDFVRR